VDPWACVPFYVLDIIFIRIWRFPLPGIMVMQRMVREVVWALFFGVFDMGISRIVVLFNL